MKRLLLFLIFSVVGVVLYRRSPRAQRLAAKIPDLQAETVASLAERYWEQEGRPEGRAHEHWLRAEAELQRLRAMAGELSA